MGEVNEMGAGGRGEPSKEENEGDLVHGAGCGERRLDVACVWKWGLEEGARPEKWGWLPAVGPLQRGPHRGRGAGGQCAAACRPPHRLPRLC